MLCLVLVVDFDLVVMMMWIIDVVIVVFVVNLLLVLFVLLDYGVEFVGNMGIMCLFYDLEEWLKMIFM